MKDWFTINHIDADTHIISEYRHWEETHAYLLNGKGRSLLIDTGPRSNEADTQAGYCRGNPYSLGSHRQSSVFPGFLRP